MDAVKQVARSFDISTKVAQLYQKRTKIAQEHFSERLSTAYADCAAGLNAKPVAPTQTWSPPSPVTVRRTPGSIAFRG